MSNTALIFPMTMALRSVSTLLESFGDAVWRADALASSATGVVATGHTALDAELPGGGWPVGALCEILQTHSGQHEWRLLIPALRHLPQRVVLVGAPHAPFGPGLAAQGLNMDALLWVRAADLAERLWAAEQLLRCAGVDALLLWLPRVRADHLRRLHMAAQAHAKLLFVMRAADAQAESSPAVLRLLVAAEPDTDDLTVQILKRRGPPLPHALCFAARPAALAVLLALRAEGLGSAASAGQSWLTPGKRPEQEGHVLGRLAATA